MKVVVSATTFPAGIPTDTHTFCVPKTAIFMVLLQDTIARDCRLIDVVGQSQVIRQCMVPAVLDRYFYTGDQKQNLNGLANPILSMNHL